MQIVKDPYCVGNSHATISTMYSQVSARCECNGTLHLTVRGEWVHNDRKRLCPPYECACGQRHGKPASS